MYTKFWIVNLKERDFERMSHRWECNIEVDLKDMGREGVDYNNLAQNSDGGGCCDAVMNLRVP
jgi:hypothetical protein